MKKTKYWDISTLKKRAKTVLKETYWQSFGGSLFTAYVPAVVKSLMIRLACIGSFMAAFRQLRRFFTSGRLDRYILPFFGARMGMFRLDPEILLRDPDVTDLLITLGSAVISVSLVALLYKVLIQNLFEVGECRLYTSNRYGNRNFGNVFYGFKDRYGHNMWAMFLRNLFLKLWTLLLIVPGIIKGFAYSMTPWIMAENPNLKATRAITISRRMMKGEKMRKFWLDLSFIGWYILGALCFGVGILFVIPYHKAATAELYGALRIKAVKEGIVSPSELCAELFAQIPADMPQNGSSYSDENGAVNEEEYSDLESSERVAEEVTEVTDKEQPGYTEDAGEPEVTDIPSTEIVDPENDAEISEEPAVTEFDLHGDESFEEHDTAIETPESLPDENDIIFD